MVLWWFFFFFPQFLEILFTVYLWLCWVFVAVCSLSLVVHRLPETIGSRAPLQ